MSPFFIRPLSGLQVDVCKPFQHAQGRDLLVGGSIVYNGDGESLFFSRFESETYLRKKVAGGDQVNICSALFLQFQENFGKALDGYDPPGFSQGDIVILAEDAPEAAAGEKYGTGAEFA